VILHSLAFLGGLPSAVTTLVDVGSGAGLPGIPLAVVRPGVAVTLVETRQRRVSFLSTVVRELSLDRVAVVASRAEELGEAYVGKFDAVVMRCAGARAAVLPAATRLVRSGGVVVVSAAAGNPAPPSAERVWVRGIPPRRRQAFDVFRVD
jgi:16S rRNA (guanine527-N7)-methyltransferase